MLIKLFVSTFNNFCYYVTRRKLRFESYNFKFSCGVYDVFFCKVCPPKTSIRQKKTSFNSTTICCCICLVSQTKNTIMAQFLPFDMYLCVPCQCDKSARRQNIYKKPRKTSKRELFSRTEIPKLSSRAAHNYQKPFFSHSIAS